MKSKLFYLNRLAVLLLMFATTVFSQDITNTLAPSGKFIVKDATTDFFILNQSNGTATLPLQLGGDQRGSIFKGTDKFLHTYYGSGTDGNNTFLGINAGNFTMGGINSYEGSANTGVGYRSLFSNSTGYRNSAFGFQSLYYNTTGSDNSAFGLNSLLFNTTGNGNSAFGRASLYSNTIGINNTAIGLGALNNNTAGNNATAIGYNAMLYTNNTIAAFDNLNVAVGYEALRGSTTPASNTGNSNTAIGYQTLRNNSEGGYNSACGSRSLNSNITGNNNSAFGFQSLYYNTTGSDNSAFGLNSLLFNQTGNGNSAFGRASLYSNTIGINNTAIGFGALNNNTAGNNATAIGYNAMLYTNNTIAAFDNFNVAVGFEALRGSTTPANNIGNANTAIGYQTLRNNASGDQNTATGYLSLYSNTTGDNNTALGYGTGNTITTGSNLTCIGYDAEPTSATATNQITLGNNLVSVLRCNTQTITSLSDERDKKNINDLNLGIDFLMKIKPRQFNWDKREWYNDNTSDGSKMKEEPTAGFIAQELDEAQTTGNAEWLNLVLKDNPEKWEATPGNLLPIMVKAIQELKIKNEQLKIEKNEEIAVLQNKNQNLEERLAKFEEMQTVLAKKIERIESSEQLIKVQIVNSENNNQ